VYVHVLSLDYRENHNTNSATKPFENITKFKYFGMTVTNQNFIHTKIMSTLTSVNASSQSNSKYLSSHLLYKNTKIKIYKTVVLPVISYECER
jgi:hypothetical protein